jgi:hypothetical protein
MKTTILIFLLFVSGSLLSQAGNYFSHLHDSILFDSGDKNFSKTEDECEVMVSWVFGSVEGQTYEEKLIKICGENDKEKIVVTRDFKPGDKLVIGQTIETKRYSSLTITLPDRSFFKIAPNSKFTIPKGICDGQAPDYFKNPVILMIGKFFSETSKVLGLKQDFQFETERCGTGHRGTKYSIEVTDTADIIKVYEGSVEVKPKKKKEISTGEELSKLSRDFQEGKITMEEFIAGSKELTEKLQKETSEYGDLIIVEAGFQVTIGDKTGDIIPIEANDDKWWDKK